MANNITLAKEFTDDLDLVYKAASVTSRLITASDLAREGANANEMVIPMLSMSGLSDYSRNDGYTVGDVTLSWESVKCNYDRGKKFQVDVMDIQESKLITEMGRVAGEFMRVHVAPEKDAFTFSQLAQKAGTTASADLKNGKEVTAAIAEALDAMDAEEVSGGRYLFITSAMLRAVEQLDTIASRQAINEFEDRIVLVPPKRFYSKIKLKDGGFEKDTAGKTLNFMIVEPSAVIKFDKHVASNIIVAENNPDADGHILKYREYGIVDVYGNKTAGIYAHTAASE